MRLHLDAYDWRMEILNDNVLGCRSVELSHELVAFGLCRSEAFLAEASNIQQHSATIQESRNCLIPKIERGNLMTKDWLR